MFSIKNQRWSRRVVWKYTLLQLPGLAALILILMLIQQWVRIPLWMALGSVVLWVIKDIILFPFVWRAYESSSKDEMHTMIGTRGIAKENLSPSGLIQVRGELWKAELMDGRSTVEAGKIVKVRDVRGLTLLVNPDDDNV